MYTYNYIHNSALPHVYVLQRSFQCPPTYIRITTFISVPSYVYQLQHSLQCPPTCIHITTFITAPFYVYTYYNVHCSAFLNVYILQRSLQRPQRVYVLQRSLQRPPTCIRITTFITAPSYMYTYYNVHYRALLHVYILQRSLQRPPTCIHITTFITAQFYMYTYYNIHAVPSYMYIYNNVHYSVLLHVYILQRSL